MTRPIKFRAWDKIEKEMFVPGTFSLSEPPQSVFRADGIRLDYPKDAELMQFTGLTDSKGNEIYEGDIIECGTWRGEVVWNKDCWVIKTKNKGIQQLGFHVYGTGYHKSTLGKPVKIGPSPIKIIGNKWENSELLDG